MRSKIRNFKHRQMIEGVVFIISLLVRNKRQRHWEIILVQLPFKILQRSCLFYTKLLTFFLFTSILFCLKCLLHNCPVINFLEFICLYFPLSSNVSWASWLPKRFFSLWLWSQYVWISTKLKGLWKMYDPSPKVRVTNSIFYRKGQEW